MLLTRNFVWRGKVLFPLDDAPKTTAIGEVPFRRRLHSTLAANRQPRMHRQSASEHIKRCWCVGLVFRDPPGVRVPSRFRIQVRRCKSIYALSKQSEEFKILPTARMFMRTIYRRECGVTGERKY